MKKSYSVWVKFWVVVNFSLGANAVAQAEPQKTFKNEYAVYGDADYSKNRAVTEWNSKEGLALFERALSKAEFYQLAPYYQPQINPAYCGMATLTMLQNYFRMKNPGVPGDPVLDLHVNQPENKVVTMPFQGYSQLTFFKNPEIVKIKTEERVMGANKAPPFDPGVNLDEFAAMAKILKLRGEAVHVDKALKDSEDGFKQFIRDLKAALKDEKSVLVANFRGKFFGAPTGGHISPLVALAADPKDKKILNVLILDVAAHKNPWTWVRAKDFYYAMNTIDKTPTGEKYRGYIVLSDATK